MSGDWRTHSRGCGTNGSIGTTDSGALGVKRASFLSFGGQAALKKSHAR
jgi:hypothetical protein